MTQEEKDLLFKDLCGRQTYNVKCQVFDDANPYTLSGVLHNKPFGQLYFEELDWKEFDGFVNVEYCKPYLFPLSSMTDELWDKEFRGYAITEFTRDSFKYGCETLEFNDSNPNLSSMVRFINQLIKNHFDIYGLIPMGLAIDATNKNIY